MSDAQPADPRLDYTGQTEGAVNADYADMPGGALIFLVDKTSGAALEGGAVLYSGGAGIVGVPYNASTPGGQYVLVANDAYGNELAQTVAFYISGDDSGSTL